MKLYADLPARRTRQVLGDLAAVGWLCLWVVLGSRVHDATLRLRAPGYRLESSGSELAGRLRDAGDRVSSVPLVGDDVQQPFERAGRAAEGLASAGTSQIEAVEALANWLGVAVALIPILVVAAIYAPARVRFVRSATAGQRFLDSAADLDLFALRALTHQPLHLLAMIDDDPAGAWRRSDRAVVDSLALLELRTVGLQAPQGTGAGRMSP